MKKIPKIATSQKLTSVVLSALGRIATITRYNKPVGIFIATGADSDGERVAEAIEILTDLNEGENGQ